MTSKSLIYTDDELIEKCIKGDIHAQKYLYLIYSPKLYAICCRYSSCRENAKDILQDSFIKIFNNLKSYKKIGSLEGWLKKIVVNTALTKYKQTKNSVITYTAEAEIIIEQSDNEIEENVFLQDYDEKMIIDAIAALSDEYRIVFNLHCIENHSHKEIAELLSIKEETSRIRLLRARKKIIAMLTGLKINQ